MGERCPHSPLRGAGWLEGWRLTFGGEDLGWDGAMATVVQDPFEQVFVAVYDVTDEDAAPLDQWESADTGLFRKVRVRVSLLDGEVLAWIYVLDAFEGGLPSARYLGASPSPPRPAARRPTTWAGCARASAGRRDCEATCAWPEGAPHGPRSGLAAPRTRKGRPPMATDPAQFRDEPEPQASRRGGQLLFAGVGSIIGSGWLFGALNASRMAGPAAIFSWALAGVMILLIGLCFAELGTMFPVSGGVVRFPHLSFGSFASYTMGWITWIAAATTAPIEVEGALSTPRNRAVLHRPEPGVGETYTLTGLGYVVAVVGWRLRRAELLRHPLVRAGQQRAGVVEAAIIMW